MNNQPLFYVRCAKVHAYRWALCAPVVFMLVGCPPGTSADAGTGAPDAAGTMDSGAPDMNADAGDDAGSREPLVCGALPSGAQSERLGDTTDSIEQPTRRVVIMGGAAEVDAHSARFVESAGGGDVLVLRASGSVSTYTPYFYSELDATPAPASSETIRLDDPSVGADEAVLCRTVAAEALWLAGGDQFNYLGLWPMTLHEAISGAAVRGAGIGGTSAGAMALGEFAFDAELGSVTSAEALAAPLSDIVSVIPSPVAQPELAATIVDTHFSAREREGRLLAFMARAALLADQPMVWGIGLDERASLALEDASFVVASGAAGRSVFVYRLAELPVLAGGEALNLVGVMRRRLLAMQVGAWPPAMDTADVDVLDVTDGVVSVR